MTSLSSVICAQCQAPNAPDGRFCRGCGKPLIARAVPQFDANANQGNIDLPGGAMNLRLDAPAAFAAVAAGIQSAGGSIVAQSPPQALQFRLGYKNIWITGWLPIMFDCQAMIQPLNAGSSQVSFAMRASLSYVLRVAAGIVAAAAVLLLGVLQVPLGVALLAAVASIGFVIWAANMKGPQELRKLLQSAVAAQLQPAAAPVAAVSPGPMPAAAAAPKGGGAGAIEQLQKLAELRQLGAISDTEFDAKKAELLARV